MVERSRRDRHPLLLCRFQDERSFCAHVRQFRRVQPGRLAKEKPACLANKSTDLKERPQLLAAAGAAGSDSAGGLESRSRWETRRMAHGSSDSLFELEFLSS